MEFPVCRRAGVAAVGWILEGPRDAGGLGGEDEASGEGAKAVVLL